MLIYIHILIYIYTCIFWKWACSRPLPEWAGKAAAERNAQEVEAQRVTNQRDTQVHIYVMYIYMYIYVYIYVHSK